MPKMTVDYPKRMNILAPEGMRERLIAISYFRGDAGEFSEVARDFVEAGIQAFERGLSEKDKRRYREILENVEVARAMKRG